MDHILVICLLVSGFAFGLGVTDIIEATVYCDTLCYSTEGLGQGHSWARPYHYVGRVGLGMVYILERCAPP